MLRDVHARASEPSYASPHSVRYANLLSLDVEEDRPAAGGVDVGGLPVRSEDDVALRVRVLGLGAQEPDAVGLAVERELRDSVLGLYFS